MFKRNWIALTLVLAVSVVLLSACGSNDLAEDLTPIPTLADQEQPELKEALRESAAHAAQADDASDAAAGETDETAASQDQLVALGEQLFTSACAGCHGAEPGAGPALTGMADRAAERVEGQSAEDYLHESIVEPGAYLVDGYGNIMPADYGEQYSDEELDAMVAYIMVEGTESGAAGEDEAADESDAETEAADDGDTTDDSEAEDGADSGAADEATPTEEPADDDSDDADAGDNLDDTADDAESDNADDAEDAPADDTPAESTDGEDEAADDAEADDAAAAERPAGDAANGETLFASACSGCHMEQEGVGPALPGMGERAAERVEGQSAEDYLHESIVDPGAYVVEGYQNIMPNTYTEQFDEQEIADLVAYMLTQ